MNAHFSFSLRRAGLVAGLSFGLSGVAFGADATAAAGTPAAGDTFPTYESYIKLSGLGQPYIKGDKNAYQERMQQSANGGGGIEDLHYSASLPQDSTLVVDGRALVGAEDYLAQFHFTRNDFGSFEIGLKRFRTFYDGVGGFFPVDKQWMPLSPEGLHVDRSKFWIEGTLNLPKMPVISFRFTDEIRAGTKDSTIWGDTDQTGLPFNLAPIPISPARKIVPSYLRLNEHHKNLEATVKYAIGKTTFEVTAMTDRVKNADDRYVTRFPGEAIPWSIASLSNTAPASTGRSPQAIAKAAAPATSWNNQVLIDQTDGNATKSHAVNGKIDSILSDKFSFHVGGNYQVLNGDVSGNRPLITTTPTSSGSVPVTTATFQNLVGDTRAKTATGNASLDWNAFADFVASVGIRSEEEWLTGHSTYNVLAASGTPATTVTSTPRMAYAKITQHNTTPVLDLRYSGIKNLSLYLDAEQHSLGGNENNTSAYNPLSPASRTIAINNLKERHGDWKLGANWKVVSIFTLRAELFEKHHKFESAGTYLQSDGGYDYYLLDNSFKGYRITGILKPLPELTITARYVKQHGTYTVTGFKPTYGAFDAGDSKNDNIGGSIDWRISKAVYAQLNGNLVYNSLRTIYPRAGGTPFTVNSSGTVTALGFDTNGILQNADNNYETCSALVGFVADKDTDMQLQFTYYNADNGDPYLAAMTQPYGVAEHESSITLSVKHKINASMVLNGKIGLFDVKSDSTGGFTNVHGPMAYLSLECKL